MAEHKDKIKGGLADKKKPSDFNSAALKQGTKVEKEHTKDKSIAKEIANTKRIKKSVDEAEGCGWRGCMRVRLRY